MKRKFTRSIKRGLGKRRFTQTREVKTEDSWTETAYINLATTESDSEEEYMPDKRSGKRPVVESETEDEVSSESEEEMYFESKSTGKKPVNEEGKAEQPTPRDNDLVETRVEYYRRRCMVTLKPEGTRLPGSPGYLPKEIDVRDWYAELEKENNQDRTYRDMVEYSVESAPFREPYKPKRGRPRKDHRTEEEKRAWYKKPYGFTKRF